MRLATLRTGNTERLFARRGDEYVDLNATDPSLPALIRPLMHVWDEVLPRVRAAVASEKAITVPAAGAAYAPPVSVPSKIPWFNVTGTEVEQTCTQMGGAICTRARFQTACTPNAACTFGFNPRGGP